MSIIIDGTNGISDIDGTASTPAIRGTDANTGIFFPAADTVAISEGGVESARFNSSGNLQLVNSLSVGNATPTTSGAGLTFPATQSASTDANTLDDYEEGTWTPTLTGSTTAGTTVYSDQYGRYTKIGNQVTVQYYLAVSSATGTGNVGITGLPFTSSSTNQGAGALMTENLNWDVTTASIVTYIGNSSSLLRVYLSSDNAGWQAQQMVNESQNYIGTHTYFV